MRERERWEKRELAKARMYRCLLTVRVPEAPEVEFGGEDEQQEHN